MRTNKKTKKDYRINNAQLGHIIITFAGGNEVEMKLHWHKFFSEAPNCFNQKNHWHLSMWCDIHAVHSRFYTKGIKIYVFLFVF